VCVCARVSADVNHGRLPDKFSHFKTNDAGN
jgi:hypothetical protein